jgi:hypothetical protein
MARLHSETSSGAWLPWTFFVVLTAAAVFLVGMEVLNIFRQPSIRTVSGPAAHRFSIYQRTGSRQREAWFFHEPKGNLGPPVCFLHVVTASASDESGPLHWTHDGCLLIGTQRAPRTSSSSGTVWVYDFTTSSLLSSDHRNQRSGIPAQPATVPDLDRLIQRHGGRGPIALQWYDLGKKHQHLFAWRITRWENAIPPNQPTRRSP